MNLIPQERVSAPARPARRTRLALAQEQRRQGGAPTAWEGEASMDAAQPAEPPPSPPPSPPVKEGPRPPRRGLTAAIKERLQPHARVEVGGEMTLSASQLKSVVPASPAEIMPSTPEIIARYESEEEEEKAKSMPPKRSTALGRGCAALRHHSVFLYVAALIYPEGWTPRRLSEPQAAHLFCTTLLFNVLSMEVALWWSPTVTYVDDLVDFAMASGIGAAGTLAVSLLVRVIFHAANARQSKVTPASSAPTAIAWAAALFVFYGAVVASIAFAIYLKPSGVVASHVLYGLGIRIESEQRWFDLYAGWVFGACCLWLLLEPLALFVCGILAWVGAQLLYCATIVGRLSARSAKEAKISKDVR